MNNSDLNNGRTSDMNDHFQARVGKIRIEIEIEISKQQKPFKVFFTINIKLATSWVNQNKGKQVKINRQALHFNIIIYKSTGFISTIWE